MNSRERLLKVLKREIPDCVPVCPDISNMIPARLTGKPFWDIYVYKDPPLWKAYIDAVKYFDIDGGFELYDFGDLFDDLNEYGDLFESHGPSWEQRIVQPYDDGGFVTQDFDTKTGTWSQFVTVHTKDNPPATDVRPESIGMEAIPSAWQRIEGIKKWPKGMELWKQIKKEMGNHGIVGMWSGAQTLLLRRPEDIFAYYENPAPFYERRERMIECVDKRMKIIAGLDEKPDFLFCGASGSLVFQSHEIFRELALPVLKHATEKAAEIEIPTHVHSCGPESLLVKMAAEETKLTVIDPLEIPPMGDCNLKELKQLYGDKIILKGNIHTIQVMLHGTPEMVREASRKAIDDAADGGGFILSTGDQCGRDTPDENIFTLVETARTYGRYT